MAVAASRYFTKDNGEPFVKIHGVLKMPKLHVVNLVTWMLSKFSQAAWFMMAQDKSG
jgi:hypothetical protein